MEAHKYRPVRDYWSALWLGGGQWNNKSSLIKDAEHAENSGGTDSRRGRHTQDEQEMSSSIQDCQKQSTSRLETRKNWTRIPLQQAKRWQNTIYGMWEMIRYWQKALNRSPKETKTQVSWHSVKKTHWINHKVSPDCPPIAQHTSVFIAVMSQVHQNPLLRKWHHCDVYCRSVEEVNLSG